MPRTGPVASLSPRPLSPETPPPQREPGYDLVPGPLWLVVLVTYQQGGREEPGGGGSPALCSPWRRLGRQNAFGWGTAPELRRSKDAKIRAGAGAVTWGTREKQQLVPPKGRADPECPPSLLPSLPQPPHPLCVRLCHAAPLRRWALGAGCRGGEGY